MFEFLTLIILMCEQPGVGHGNSPAGEAISRDIRKEAFVAKTDCIKRIYTECKHVNSMGFGKTDCAVKNL
jgi:hypothetical protein